VRGARRGREGCLETRGASSLISHHRTGGDSHRADRPRSLVAAAYDLNLTPPSHPSLIAQEHDAATIEFLSGVKPARLFAYLERPPEPTQGTKGKASDAVVPPKLVVTTRVPPKTSRWDKMLAFVRDPTKPVHPLTIAKTVHATVVTADVAGSLLGVMKGVFTPALQAKEQWPESIRKDFAGGIHRYMAQLTEQTHELRGTTKLYVPSEGYEQSDPDAAANSKDLVQRLESTVIHWTRKIREVIDADNQSPDESLGPLAEIAFWRRRGDDMSGLRDQLTDPKLLATVRVLESAKSAYLPAFLALGESVEREATAASDNAKFLSALQEPCEALAAAHAKDVAPLLPPILQIVRMIWNNAGHYATPELTYGLLRKISAEVSFIFICVWAI